WEWLILGAAATIPLLGSAALLWIAARRGLETSWAELGDLPALVAHFTRQEYGGLLSASSRSWPFWIARRQIAYWELLSGSIGVISIAFGLLGGVMLAFWGRSRIAAALGVTFLLSGPVFFAVNRVELTFEEHLAWCERFASMSHIPLAMLLGLVVERGLQAALSRSRIWSFGIALAIPIACLQPALVAYRLDLSNDYMGLYFARDLVERTPNGSVLLLRGALHRVLGEYYCAVYRACGQRVVVSAYSSWRYEQLRSRHAELGLPRWTPQLRSATIHPVIDAVLPDRQVFISPELVGRYPDILRRYRVEPDLVLWRVAPAGEDLSRALRASALSTLAEGCTTCLHVPTWLPRPTMHAQEMRQYSVGFRNLAARYRAVIGTDPITTHLEGQAQAMELPAWSSSATPGKKLERMQISHP
ncbi:MAG TPA: hypothetical protein VKP30_03460, partial [Polyangiaceae bacterium]|nr:hypothetical protein [Polyangiaceae bacterium]